MKLSEAVVWYEGRCREGASGEASVVKVRDQIRQFVAKGESTGNRAVDYLVASGGALDHESIALYRDIDDRFRANVGGPFLVYYQLQGTRPGPDGEPEVVPVQWWLGKTSGSIEWERESIVFPSVDHVWAKRHKPDDASSWNVIQGAVRLAIGDLFLGRRHPDGTECYFVLCGGDVRGLFSQHFTDERFFMRALSLLG